MNLVVKTVRLSGIFAGQCPSRIGVSGVPGLSLAHKLTASEVVVNTGVKAQVFAAAMLHK